MLDCTHSVAFQDGDIHPGLTSEQRDSVDGEEEMGGLRRMKRS